MAAQLFALAPHLEAKLYYTTMVQDEARHTEAWLKLADEAGGRAERDPYLDQLAALSLDARHARGEGLPHAGLLRAAHHPALPHDRARVAGHGPRRPVQPPHGRRRHPSPLGRRLRASAAREDATKKQKTQLVKVANRMLPIFVQHALWRPKAREVDRRAHARHATSSMLHEDIEERRAPRRVARARRRRRRASSLS